ncbi:MAG: 3-hydroxyacyl-CoA dehydrogenase [Deltaproteobacteria bacterium]|nr:3-hydroxyacyl-CoA dehydrogenase [Deltaproteobacteria bacterium]
MELKGRTALVTGGASGLGRAVVERLVGAGMNVVILDREKSEGATVAAGLGKAAHFEPSDVTSPELVKKAVDGAVARFGGLHVGVSCAGVGAAARTLGKTGPMDLEVFRTVINVNLVGTFNVARLCADAMSRNQPTADGERGVIINTASIAAFDGQVGQVPYAASKGGIVAMALPMARDLMKNGIRVVTIAPGIFDTPMLAQVPEDIRRALGESVPFPSRLGRPAEFAALAQHIVENCMLNGEVIRLDGALRMAPK